MESDRFHAAAPLMLIYSYFEDGIVLREQMVFRCPDPQHCTDRNIY